MSRPLFRILGGLIASGIVLAVLGGLALLASYLYLAPSLPSVQDMKLGALPVPLRIYTRSGQLIAQIGEQRRVPVRYEDIPPLVRDAFISAEDQRFFQHHGFDYSGVVRAIWVDLTSGHFSQGASTISMQAARNMFLTREKTARRKLQEGFVTYRLEREFTKEQILTTYLNVIFLGQRSYGVAAAGETYFGKRLDQLTPAEAATLAGITQSPAKDNPITNPKAALTRRHYVLQQMQKLGYLDAATYARAEEEPLRARDHGAMTEVEAPYVAEMARQEVVNRFGPDAVNAGYAVYTTIDGRLQTAANRAVRIGLITYDRRHGYRGALRHLSLGERENSSDFEAALRSVPEFGMLHPAVVLSVGAQSAKVYLRGSGMAEIGWIGLSWARKALPNNQVGAAPKKAEDVLARGDVIYVVSDGHGTALLAQLPEAQSALVALDPDDGAVAALVGGFDYFDNKFNRATQARRLPGSGFKPFLYSAALENGFTAADIVMDLPIVFGGDQDEEKVWRPKDNEKDFAGPITVRNALVHSRNLATIRIVQELGIDTAISYAARFGFPRQDIPRDLSVALGTLQVTPIELASAYAVFANGGYKVAPYFVDRIDDAAGNTVYQSTPVEVCEGCDPTLAPSATPAADGVAAADPTSARDGLANATPTANTPGAPITLGESAPAAAAPPKPAPPPDPEHAPTRPTPALLPAARIAPRVISAPNAWLMDDIMADVIKRGTGIRAGMALHRSDISGKTGTTNEARDTWFNGFTRHLTATVWVGYDQEQPLGEGEEGSRTAVPIWVLFMREALRDQPDVPRAVPPGIEKKKVNVATGHLAADNDPLAGTEYFMDGHLPRLAESSSTPDPGAENPAGSSEPLF